MLIFIIMGLFGIATTSAVAVLGSAGVAVGLALQGSLSNFAGGVLILLLKPFKVGDYIIEHSHNNEGTVTEISIFYTKLLTVDNKLIVIPNGTLSNKMCIRDRYCRHHDADHKAQFYRKGCHKACGHDPQSIPDRTEGASGPGARRYPEGYYGGKDGV